RLAAVFVSVAVTIPPVVMGAGRAMVLPVMIVPSALMATVCCAQVAVPFPLRQYAALVTTWMLPYPTATVAGETGAPTTAYWILFEPILPVTWTNPLYSGWTAPMMFTQSPIATLLKPVPLDDVAVATAPARVMGLAAASRIFPAAFTTQSGR